MRGTARFIRVWGSGQLGLDILGAGEAPPATGSLAVVLERAAHLDRARESGLVGPDTRVFVPGATDSAEGPVVLGYDGSLSDPGSDVQIGPQFFLQTQDYGTSEYLSLIGATLIRIVDEGDFSSFLDDADAALSTGTFLDFATHPLVRLCDAAALGGSAPEDGPRLRLHVDAAGEISTSTSGAALGRIGDDLSTLQAAWDRINAASARPCAVSLAKVLPEQVRVDAFAQRPWLPRYHAALAALRSVRARDLADVRDVRVSGFGGRLVPELADVHDPWDLGQADAPVLVWTDDCAYLCAVASERLFRVSTTTAAHIERLLVTGALPTVGTAAEVDQLSRIRDHFVGAGLRLCA